MSHSSEILTKRFSGVVNRNLSPFIEIVLVNDTIRLRVLKILGGEEVKKKVFDPSP